MLRGRSTFATRGLRQMWDVLIVCVVLRHLQIYIRALRYCIGGGVSATSNHTKTVAAVLRVGLLRLMAVA